MSVSKTSGRGPVLGREESQSCSLRNTKTILNVFIRTIFDDWVFCVNITQINQRNLIWQKVNANINCYKYRYNYI